MIRTAVQRLCPLLALLAFAGCGHFRSRCEHGPAEAEEGHAVPRTRIDPETWVSPVSLDAEADDRTYWGMTPHETQCRAAEKSGTADMMEKESQSLDAKNCVTRNSKNTRMKQTMLRHSAVEARNVDAGTALELYYRLADLEAKSDLLRDSLVHVAAALTDLRKAKEQGLKVPSEYERLVKQQLDVAADLARAQLGIQQINGELGRLLSWHDLGLRGYLWPVASFTVIETDDDPEAAVALGLTHRAQLTMLRAVRDDVDAKTLPTMLLLLRSYNGFLGMSRSESFVSFLSASVLPGKQKQAGERKQQMDDMIKEQEYVVAQEIRQAIHTIQAKGKLVALAKEKNRYAQDKLKDLTEKKEGGVASVLEVSAQRFNVAAAQGELIQEVMAWHTARAKLKQAQGLLALECGYAPEHPWSGAGHACSQELPSPAYLYPDAPAPASGPEQIRAPVGPPLRPPSRPSVSGPTSSEQLRGPLLPAVRDLAVEIAN